MHRPNPESLDTKASAAAAGCVIGCFILGCIIATLGFLTILRWFFP